MNALIFFYQFIQPFNHSHVRISFPRWSRWLFLSPHQHQIHHSSELRHQNKNLGIFIALPDLLAKTLYVPTKEENPRPGLADPMAQIKFDSIWYIYFGAPLAALAILFRRSRNRPR